MIMNCVYWIRGIYRRCRAFVTRGRHGYASTDTASVNMYLARVVAGVLTEYLKELESPTSVAGHPSVLDGLEAPQEEWVSIVREIRDGFQGYLDWEYEGWMSPDLLHLDVSSAEWVAAYRVREQEVFDSLKRSFELMNKWFPYLWW